MIKITTRFSRISKNNAHPLGLQTTELLSAEVGAALGVGIIWKDTQFGGKNLGNYKYVVPFFV
jgi:hypothetical protein